MVCTHYTADEPAADGSALVELRHSLKQVMCENRLLEQEIRSVRELRVGVASWLLQGSAMGGSPLCRQFVPGNEDADVAPGLPEQIESQPRLKRSRED